VAGGAARGAAAFGGRLTSWLRISPPCMTRPRPTPIGRDLSQPHPSAGTIGTAPNPG
jgi:hypothetical protein